MFQYENTFCNIYIRETYLYLHLSFLIVKTSELVQSSLATQYKAGVYGHTQRNSTPGHLSNLTSTKQPLFSSP